MKIKTRLHVQLLLAMSTRISIILGVIIIIVSYRENRLLTEHNLDKYDLLTQQYTSVAINNFDFPNLIEKKLLEPLGQRNEVVYVYLTDTRGKIRTSLSPSVLYQTDPKVVLPLFRFTEVLRERETNLDGNSQSGTFIIQKTTLLDDVKYNDEIRGEKGEVVLDAIQQLYFLDEFIGYLRIGFSLRSIDKELATTRNLIIGVGLFLIVLSIGLVILIARRVTKPLEQLTAEVSKVQTSDHNLPLEKQLSIIRLDNIVSTNREIDDLKSAFIQMRTYVISSLAEMDQTHVALEIAKEELEQLNENLEKEVVDRTRELQHSMNQMEQQNITLVASNRKLEDLNSSQEQLLAKLSTLQSSFLKPLQDNLSILKSEEENNFKEVIRQLERDVHGIEEIIRPFTSSYQVKQAIRSKRVLLAESNKRHQILAKMALIGTGVELDIVADFEEGHKLLNQYNYDILFVGSETVELVKIAHKKSPNTKSVFMTSEDTSVYLTTLKRYPFLSNIVTRNEEDRTFTLKNILTTVSKLISEDLFGLDKYLSWGIDIQKYPITDSDTRSQLVHTMSDYLDHLGIRRTLITKCILVAEELLMNAIYDAPYGTDGKPLYNHFPRTKSIHLGEMEQGVFRFACDGILLAISVEDPFGSFRQETLLTYLQKSYGGQRIWSKKKGGAGYGLYQIMEISDLLVFNVKEGIKTEAIAIFNIAPNKLKSDRNTSFHYFSG